MTALKFPFFFLLILCCQSNDSAAQKREGIKHFKVPSGDIIADFSRNDSFLLFQKIYEGNDTICFTPSPVIYDVPDLKMFDSTCIILINNGITIHFLVFKKESKKWLFVGTRQLIYIDRPIRQEIKIVNEQNIQVWAQNKLISEYLIDYEKKEFKLVDYYKK